MGPGVVRRSSEPPRCSREPLGGEGGHCGLFGGHEPELPVPARGSEESWNADDPKARGSAKRRSVPKSWKRRRATNALVGGAQGLTAQRGGSDEEMDAEERRWCSRGLPARRCLDAARERPIRGCRGVSLPNRGRQWRAQRSGASPLHAGLGAPSSDARTLARR